MIDILIVVSSTENSVFIFNITSTANGDLTRVGGADQGNRRTSAGAGAKKGVLRVSAAAAAQGSIARS